MFNNSSLTDINLLHTSIGRWILLLPVGGIIVLCHFRKNDLLPVITENNSLCISLVRQIGFPVHFISVEHCCHLVLIEDISQMWQVACHIWKYYIIKCYKMHVIVTYNDRHYRTWHTTAIPLSDYIIQNGLNENKISNENVMSCS